MAERKAQNKYYPPDFDPRTGSLDKLHGQHPLRERARKLHLGILIIRFELPFNIWCNHCNTVLRKSTRFNAEKKEVGKYYSTKIWSFRFKCRHCSGWIEIRTDPKNSTYRVVTGGRAKTEEYSEADAEVEHLSSEQLKSRLASDPIFRLEHGKDEKIRAQLAADQIKALRAVSRADFGDDFASSSLLRRKFRAEKRSIETEEKEVRDRVDRGFTTELLPASPHDQRKARKVLGANAQKRIRREIKTSSIFGDASALQSNSLNKWNLERSAKRISSRVKARETRNSPSGEIIHSQEGTTNLVPYSADSESD